MAGIGLWRGRPRARVAGLALAVLGFLLTPVFFGILLPTDLGRARSETAYVSLPEWPGILTLVANGVAFVGLMNWQPEEWRAPARPPS